MSSFSDSKLVEMYEDYVELKQLAKRDAKNNYFLLKRSPAAFVAILGHLDQSTRGYRMQALVREYFGYDKPRRRNRNICDGEKEGKADEFKTTFIDKRINPKMNFVQVLREKLIKVPGQKNSADGYICTVVDAENLRIQFFYVTRNQMRSEDRLIGSSAHMEDGATPERAVRPLFDPQNEDYIRWRNNYLVGDISVEEFQSAILRKRGFQLW